MRFKVVAIFLLLLLSGSIWAATTKSDFNLWLQKGELHTSTDVAFSEDPYPSTESDPVEYAGELDLSNGSASIYATAKTASYEPVTLYVIFSGLKNSNDEKAQYLPLTVTYDPETTGGETTKTAENSAKVHIQLDETFAEGASGPSEPIRALSYKLDLSTEGLDSLAHGSHYKTTMTLALEAN